MAKKIRLYDAEYERNTYDAEYYQNHIKYYQKGIPHFVSFMNDNIQFESLCDLGCGTGAFSSPFQNYKDVLGVDFSIGSEKVNFLDPKNFMLGDLTQPLNLGRSYDVVMSLEVWEHLLPQCENDYLNNVFALHPKTLVISCAPPEQWGRHHYTPHTGEEVINIIGARGYKLNDTLTDGFRKIPKLASFYRKNTYVFNPV